MQAAENKQVLVFTVSSDPGGAERCIEKILNSGNASHEFSLKLIVLRTSAKKDSLLQNALPWWKLLFSQADVIHTHLFWPALFVRTLKFFDSRPNWVHTVHYADYVGQRWAKVKKVLDKFFIFPKVDRLVFVSETARNNFSLSQKSDVILNSVDMTTRGSLISAGCIPTIGCVSMFRAEKGLLDLLIIFKKFKAQYPNARLKLAGDGQLKHELIQSSKELGIFDSVQFCGFVKDFDSFYKDVTIYFQPSLSESFGIASLEALSYTKPVIAAKVGNLVRLFDESRGYLVERNEHFFEQSLFALIDIMKDYPKAQKKAEAARKYWEDRLKPGQMEARYFQIYKEISNPSVCVIAPLVTHAIGGLQQQLHLQTLELKKMGYRIFILQNKDPRLVSLKKEDQELQGKWSHAEFLSVPQPFIKPRIRGAWYIIYGAYLLWRYRTTIHVLHAHQLYSPTLLGAIGKVFTRAPLVVKVTASGLLGEAAELKKLPFFYLRKLIFKKIDRVFALTDDMRAEVIGLGIDQNKVVVISNSVELPSLPNFSKKACITPKVTSLLFVGRLSEEKSIETLLLAADALHQGGHSIRLEIVGGAYGGRDASAKLFRLAKSFKSGVEIIFHGEHKDVSTFYNQRPIYILPSASEGMSNSLLEAMSFGLVCIVSDIKANTFLIKHMVNGLHFKQGDVASLAKAIETCIEPVDPLMTVSLSLAARKTIEDNFSTKIIGKKISLAYAEVQNKQ